MHHHAIFEQVLELDQPLVLLNLFVLMTIAVLPFPTSLVGEYIDQGDDAVTTMVA